MADTLFNQFADEAALQAQRDFFLKEILAPIKEGIKSTNINLGTIDSSQSKKSVDELAKTIDTLENKLGVAQKEIVALTARLNEYAAANSNAAKSQKDAVTASTELTVSLKEGSKAAYDNAKAKKDAANSEVIAAKAALDTLKAKDGVTAAELKGAKAALDNAKAKRDSANADLAAAKAAISAAEAKNSVVKEALTEQKAAEAAANDYLQLAKAYNETALKAKNYALRLGETHPVTVQATKDALDMANLLKKLDASVGQNQRNVGDYKKAVAGLGFSFTQVARELPSLAVNFQQFALAISNNLPFVFDSLRETSNQIAALKKEGKEAPSLFSAIGRSLFSWQAGLAVAITLFTVFAKEIGDFFSKVILGKKSLEELTEEMIDLTEESQRARDGIKKLTEDIDRLNEAADILVKINFTDDFEADVLNLQGRIVGLQAEITNLGNAEKEQIKISSEASAVAIDNLSESGQKLIAKFGLFRLIPDAAVEDVSKADKRLIDGAKKAQNDLLATQKDLEQKRHELNVARLRLQLRRAEEERKNEEDNVKEIQKLFIADLEFKRDQLQKQAGDENKFIADRIKARQDAAEIDRKIVRLKANFEIAELRKAAADDIAEQKGNAENIRIIQSNLAKEISFIQRTAAVDQKRIAAERDEDILKLQDEFYKLLINNVARNQKLLAEARRGVIEDRNEQAQKEFDEEKLIIQAFYDQELRILSANLKQKKITLEEYNLGVKANDRALKKSLIEAEIDHVKKQIATERLKPDEGNAIALETRLFNLRKQLRDQDINDYSDYANKIAEINKKINEDIRRSLEKLTDQVKETLFAALAGTYDAQINKIRDQIDAVNELKAAEIERVNSSTDTAEVKAARIKIIESRAQNDREALERRQRQIERNRAIVERAQSAFTITIAGIRDVARIKSASTVAFANAMATIPPPFNVPAAIASRLSVLKEIPISIATTAASLAAILATPIPRFYTGTDYSPEGLAEVAERGPELAIDQKGNAKVYEKHTLTYLTKGTKIYPADATKDILNAAEQERTGLLKAFNNNVTISTPDHSEELKKQTKILERIEGKSRIAIINNAPIETEAWYQQHFKY